MGRRLGEHTLATFHDSLDRVLAKNDFFDVFYDRLMARSSAIAAKFDGFDMARIKRLLRDAFYLKMMASDGNLRASARLEKIADRHAELGITRDMHDQWLATLLSVVADRDLHFDAEIERSWLDVTRIAMDIMKERAPA